MSLMSMQLWTLGGLGLALVVILAAQTLAAVAYILFVVFPLMGRNYEAAVIAAGFTGISLGATPTAIANMTAVTKTARRLRPRLHHPAARLGLLHRHLQRDRDRLSGAVGSAVRAPVDPDRGNR